MNHSVFGRKLSRTKNQRTRLFSNLVRDLIIHGKISTSLAKAKAVQPLMEKLITKAKKGTDANRRRILETIADSKVTDMLLKDAKDRFTQRTSGYTRIIKTGIKRKDATEQVLLSFVDEKVVILAPKKEEKTVEVKDAVIVKEEKKESKPKKSGEKKVKSTTKK
jgi:large subunit ribosomal protein L17